MSFLQFIASLGHPALATVVLVLLGLLCAFCVIRIQDWAARPRTGPKPKRPRHH